MSRTTESRCAVKVTQAYRFALDPSPAQEQVPWSHAGAARFAWNWGLGRCAERYHDQGKWYTGTELHRLWNMEKKADPTLAWWREKTAWNGGTLVLAGRFYPSSKTCSACGTVKTKLSLSERTYSCQACGLVIGRDVNAARNLLNLAASGAERLNACGGVVRPGTAGHASVKQEPGTAPAGETGTAARQQAATGEDTLMRTHPVTVGGCYDV